MGSGRSLRRRPRPVERGQVATAATPRGAAAVLAQSLAAVRRGSGGVRGGGVGRLLGDLEVAALQYVRRWSRKWACTSMYTSWAAVVLVRAKERTRTTTIQGWWRRRRRRRRRRQQWPSPSGRPESLGGAEFGGGAGRVAGGSCRSRSCCGDSCPGTLVGVEHAPPGHQRSRRDTARGSGLHRKSSIPA